MRKLNCHSLQRDINSLCKFLDETYSINLGGCCFLASLIAKYLDKLNIKYKLVIYEDTIKDYRSIAHEITNCRKNKGFRNSVTGYYTCSHYCLQILGSGVINGSKGYIHQYTIPNISHKNIQWIYRNGYWNDSYNVQYNKAVKNIVKTFFSKYEKISSF